MDYVINHSNMEMYIPEPEFDYDAWEEREMEENDEPFFVTQMMRKIHLQMKINFISLK